MNNGSNSRIPTLLHSRERNLQDFHYAVANGESLITDIIAVRSNLRHVHCMVALQPVYDQHNNYRFMIVLCTAQKHHQPTAHPNPAGGPQLQHQHNTHPDSNHVSVEDATAQASAGSGYGSSGSGSSGAAGLAGCEADFDLLRSANEHCLRELVQLLPTQFVDDFDEDGQQQSNLPGDNSSGNFNPNLNSNGNHNGNSNATTTPRILEDPLLHGNVGESFPELPEDGVSESIMSKDT
jgi:hypothetical protein